MTPEEKALEFANRLEKQTIECPRNCLNPGLYFGYMAGYKAKTDTSTFDENFSARKTKLVGEQLTEVFNDSFHVESFVEGARWQHAQDAAALFHEKTCNEFTMNQIDELRAENESIKKQLGDFYICEDDGREQ